MNHDPHPGPRLTLLRQYSDDALKNLCPCGLTTDEVRKNFAEVVSRVAFGNQRVVLTRRGKDFAAIVPPHDLQFLGAEGKIKGAGISTMNARNNLSDVINRVAYGKEKIGLTRRDKVVAVVLPCEALEKIIEASRQHKLADTPAFPARGREKRLKSHQRRHRSLEVT